MRNKQCYSAQNQDRLLGWNYPPRRKFAPDGESNHFRNKDCAERHEFLPLTDARLLAPVNERKKRQHDEDD